MTTKNLEPMTTKNLPLSYDFHGDAPLDTPFRQIPNQDIHIYLDLDTKTGKDTCGQTCDHCWFNTYEKVNGKSFSPQEGKLVFDAISSKGFKVFPRYTDSFSYNGEFMRLFGTANNREFRQELDHKETKTMKGGDAWTSGLPLIRDNYIELLDVARDYGYKTISFTFHGLLDETLSFLGMNEYPIKGVFPGPKLVTVIQRIHAYNEAHRDSGHEFRMNVGLTVGRHNHKREMLLRYVRFFNALKVSTVRFNNYLAHGGRHPELVLSKAEIEQCYADMKWIHENEQLNFQLGMSEDFGTFGIEVMDFPSHVGMCQAGKQLFGIIPTEPRLLKREGDTVHEQIGEISACVNIFEPAFGELVRITKTSDNSVTYDLQFNHEEIDTFAKKRVDGHYKNGCFANEVLEEKKKVSPPLLVLSKKQQRAERSQ
jgi:hypothetical protein